MPKSKVVIVFDGEYLGQHIGKNPMIGMACAAVCTEKETTLSTFTRNIKPFDGSTSCQDTIDNFYKKKNPDAWAALQKNQVDATSAMNDFMDWLETFNVDEIWICCSPGSVDKAFLKWYVDTFCPERITGPDYKSPFMVFDYCFRSDQAGALGINRENFNPKKDLPLELQSNLAYTHDSADDVLNLADQVLKLCAWKRKYKHIYDLLPKA